MPNEMAAVVLPRAAWKAVVELLTVFAKSATNEEHAAWGRSVQSSIQQQLDQREAATRPVPANQRASGSYMDDALDLLEETMSEPIELQGRASVSPWDSAYGLDDGALEDPLYEGLVYGRDYDIEGVYDDEEARRRAEIENMDPWEREWARD